MRIGNDNLQIDGVDMSVEITSEPLWLGHIVNYSLQFVFTGSPSGNFKLQCSNDAGNPNAGKEVPPADYEVVNYTDVADSAVTVSGAGNVTYDVQNAGYRWVRFVWTPTSGSGTLTSARFNIKGV